jgi:hypothetical protein
VLSGRVCCGEGFHRASKALWSAGKILGLVRLGRALHGPLGLCLVESVRVWSVRPLVCQDQAWCVRAMSGAVS